MVSVLQVTLIYKQQQQRDGEKNLLSYKTLAKIGRET